MNRQRTPDTGYARELAQRPALAATIVAADEAISAISPPTESTIEGPDTRELSKEIATLEEHLLNAVIGRNAHVSAALHDLYHDLHSPSGPKQATLSTDHLSITTEARGLTITYQDDRGAVRINYTPTPLQRALRFTGSQLEIELRQSQKHTRWEDLKDTCDGKMRTLVENFEDAILPYIISGASIGALLGGIVGITLGEHHIMQQANITVSELARTYHTHAPMIGDWADAGMLTGALTLGLLKPAIDCVTLAREITTDYRRRRKNEQQADESAYTVTDKSIYHDQERSLTALRRAETAIAQAQRLVYERVLAENRRKLLLPTDQTRAPSDLRTRRDRLQQILENDVRN